MQLQSVCVCQRERETDRERQERDRGTDIPTCLQVLSSKPQIPTNATYFWKTPVHNFRSSEKPQCCVFLKGQRDLTFCPLMSSRWRGLCPRRCLCLLLPPSVGLSISRREAEWKQPTPPTPPRSGSPSRYDGAQMEMDSHTESGQTSATKPEKTVCTGGSRDSCELRLCERRGLWYLPYGGHLQGVEMSFEATDAWTTFVSSSQSLLGIAPLP